MKTESTIYGLRAVMEALQADKPINKVFLQKGISGDLFKELEYHLRKKKTSTSYVPIEKLNKLTTNNHQGAVALISPVDFKIFVGGKTKSNLSFIKVDNLTASKEVPPKSKKSSRTPTRSNPRISAQSFAISSSIGPRGAI